MASRSLLALSVLIALSAGLGALSGSFPEQPWPAAPPALNGVNVTAPAPPSPPPPAHDPLAKEPV